MSAADNAGVVAKVLGGFNARDFGATVGLTGDLLDVPSGQKMSGSAGLQQYWQAWIGAFPDAKVEILKNVGAEDGTVVTEFRARGTNNGPMTMGGQQIPATGKPVDIVFCQVSTVKDGTITEARLYYDAMAFGTQLGLMPPQGAGAR
jgi:predicted ester cyclase